jgi:RNA polymerase subunit RPABC4/transcription elongation factor Spt4
MARGTGMKTLIEDGLTKVRHGDTTLDELLRVIGPQIRHERQCDQCRRSVDAKLPFCPYCGAFKQNICMHCRITMENDWVVCGFCGRKKGEG